ncbi:NAD(P)-binding domain-containing protein [Streptomyces sp. CB01881]|uniref:NADPH-dependent F420 reductase n=1 Tax=Streptomyces sp. CB01881 TaxID=2078691 RepID=UPI000CDC5769|nr:NAD(P)-binding domain-containing protein [Streptomyces sp. CB01881]AUY53374.1 NADP oxidoreductase [Streptomyces sp. CB01881]TYC69526.1 NADP oxidoreductase [Streptomyces sp. CB01881]
MRFAVIGTGTVGQTLADKLVALGHEVMLGSRTKDNEKAVAWAEQAGPNGHHGTFADAAGFGEVVLNATSGTVSLAALRAAGAERLAGKVLVDVSNPLVFSAEGELSLNPVNTDSVGEQIQREFPQARVVKALNTLSAPVMVDPGRVPGEHNLFVAGEDAGAKAEVVSLLQEFGWPTGSVIDLGGIASARGMEMLMPFWIQLMRAFGTTDFNYSFKRAE